MPKSLYQYRLINLKSANRNKIIKDKKLYNYSIQLIYKANKKNGK